MFDRDLRKVLRPRMGSASLSLLLSAALILFYNVPFWTEVFRLHTFNLRNACFLASLFLLLVAGLNLLLSLVAFRYVQKPIAALILFSAAIAAYFMNSYGVMIDSSMIQNVVETDTGEFLELLDGKLLLYLVGLGILPALVVCRARIRYGSWVRELALKAAGIPLSLAVIGLVAVAFYPDLASLFRNHRELRHLLTPSNYIYGTMKYLRSVGPVTAEPLGVDAVLGKTVREQEKKTVVIFVLGETARAQDFSLNGYARKTNPNLEQESIVNYDNVRACGTSTAVSLPCMFSNLRRDHCTAAEARRHEGLLDVLAHAGLSVLWRDNNSGCKGVCDRIDTQEFRVAGSESFDEVLLNRLEEYLASVDNHAFIVLHQQGSHGPAYYLRHPDRFRVFTPECTSERLSDCSREEIVNAYDNTILYTDYFLSRVIGFLKEHADRYNTAMLYMSDHGESLGENNIYLHGLPYFVAPEEQTRVPFVVWLSDGFKQAFDIDTECLSSHHAEALSHDHLFHSVLGLMDVQTKIYDGSLDVFADCRGRDHDSAGGPAVVAAALH